MSMHPFSYEKNIGYTGKESDNRKMAFSKEKPQKDHDYEKKKYEAFAKEVLELCFPQKYQGLVIADRPDLRLGLNHGIEVTRALGANEEEINYLLDRISHKKYEDIQAGWECRKLDEIGARVFLNSEGVVNRIACNNPRLIDDRELCEAFWEKTKKNYPGFDVMDLFIFAPYNQLEEWFDDETIEGFLHICKPDNFDTTFVFSGHRLFAHDYQTDTVIKKVLSEEQVEECWRKAKEYAEGVR